jgi:Tfp pilus assembly protein PilV
MEASLATIIVGVGITAAMALFAACSQQNRTAANMTTAMHLAQNIQETMAGLPLIDPTFADTHFRLEPDEQAIDLDDYDDVDDFDNAKFNPPIDSTRQRLGTLSQFTQVVSVWPVQPHKLSANSNPASPDVPQSFYTGAARVTVRILYRAKPGDSELEVYRTSWIRVAKK